MGRFVEFDPICQNLASFFESIKGSFTHIKHQITVQSKGLTLVSNIKNRKILEYGYATSDKMV